MTTLREAAQQALETLEALSAAENIIWVQKRAEIEVEHLRAALAQPEQAEPVAWVELLKDAEQIVRSKPLWKKFIDGTPLANDIAVWMADFAQKHTHPPRREWQGLTEEEIDRWTPEIHPVIRAVEQALKEKNA